MFSKHYFTRHSSVTVRDILMHHDSNVGWARKNVINIMTVGLGYFLSELGPFDSFLILLQQSTSILVYSITLW